MPYGARVTCATQELLVKREYSSTGLTNIPARESIAISCRCFVRAFEDSNVVHCAGRSRSLLSDIERYQNTE